MAARVFELFRDPDVPGTWTSRLPQIYGDGIDTLWPPHTTIRCDRLLAVTATQFAHLQRWAAGNFADDWPGSPPQPPSFSSLAPAEQVAHLERAPLHECLGGPFHPGIELTWVMRLPPVWKGPIG